MNVIINSAMESLLTVQIVSKSLNRRLVSLRIKLRTLKRKTIVWLQNSMNISRTYRREGGI